MSLPSRKPLCLVSIHTSEHPLEGLSVGFAVDGRDDVALLQLRERGWAAFNDAVHHLAPARLAHLNAVPRLSDRSPEA
eukprot:280356-Rhodomonas_salina.2